MNKSAVARAIVSKAHRSERLGRANTNNAVGQGRRFGDNKLSAKCISGKHYDCYKLNCPCKCHPQIGGRHD